MSLYRKKPITVEARQLVDDDECDWEAIAEWCGGTLYNVEDAPGAEPVTLLAIWTLEGKMTAAEGDWIIRGVKGEFYPCKPDIFAETYEPVEP